MSTIIGSYSLFVPPSASWVVGPTVRKGETVRVLATGTVQFEPGSVDPDGEPASESFGDAAYTVVNSGVALASGLVWTKASNGGSNDVLVSPTGTAFRSAYNPSTGSTNEAVGSDCFLSVTPDSPDYTVKATLRWLGDYGGTGTPYDRPGPGGPPGTIYVNGRTINVSGINNNSAGGSNHRFYLYGRSQPGPNGYGYTFGYEANPGGTGGSGGPFDPENPEGDNDTPQGAGSSTPITGARWVLCRDQTDIFSDGPTYTGPAVFAPASILDGSPQAMELRMEGTSIQGWVNGAMVLSMTDATYTTAGRAGFEFKGGSSPIRGLHIDTVVGPSIDVEEPTPGLYAFPEGAYPPDFPETHAYNPSGVLQAGDWEGSQLVAMGRPPLSLAMLVLPDGQEPPFSPGGFPDVFPDVFPTDEPSLVPVAGCLSPLRERTFDAEADLGATNPNLFYRLFFLVNEGVDDFADDSGGYTVLIDRIRTSTMSLPLESLVSPRFGLQSAVGVRSDVFRMLGCIADAGFKPKPDQQWEESGTAGFGYQTNSDLIYDVSSGDVTLNLDTLDTGYVLYSAFGSEKVTTLATGVYKHDFEFDPFVQAVPRAYSAQTPTEAGEIAQAVMDLIFNGFKLGADPGKLPTASSSFLGGKLNLTGDTDMPTLSPGVNAVQVVQTNGGPTGGTFVLLDHTKPSGVINVTDAATAVQIAVRLLGGDWTLATVAGSAGNWTITSPTGKFLAPLVPDFTDAGGVSTLVGGVSPTVTVNPTTPGGFKLNPPKRCGAQSWCLKIAPSWTAIENAPISMTANWSSTVTIGERFARKWIQGCSPGAFTYVQRDGKDIVDTLELEMALIDPVRTFINSARSGQRLCARLQSTGSQIGTTGINRSFTVDMDGQAKWTDNTDSDNVRSVKIDFRALYNMTSGQMVRVSIVNEIPSYATN